MAISVTIPYVLRYLTENKESVDLEGNTVGEVLANLFTAYPPLKDRMIDEKSGKLRKSLITYVGNEDIRYLQGEETVLKASDEVLIQASQSGG